MLDGSAAIELRLRTHNIQTKKGAWVKGQLNKENFCGFCVNLIKGIRLNGDLNELPASDSDKSKNSDK